MKKGYIKVYLHILFILAIVIITIMATLHVVKNSYDKEKIETLKTDMLLIEAKVSLVAEKITIKEKDAKYIGTKASDLKDDERINTLQEKGVINIESKDSLYYLLEKSALEEVGLNNIEGTYIVDYKTSEVIYIEGITDENGNVLHKLSDIEKLK